MRCNNSLRSFNGIFRLFQDTLLDEFERSFFLKLHRGDDEIEVRTETFVHVIPHQKNREVQNSLRSLVDVRDMWEDRVEYWKSEAPSVVNQLLKAPLKFEKLSIENHIASAVMECQFVCTTVRVELWEPRVGNALPGNRTAYVCESFPLKHMAVSLDVTPTLAYELRSHFDAVRYLHMRQLAFSASAFTCDQKLLDTMNEVTIWALHGFRWSNSSIANEAIDEDSLVQ